MVLHACACQKIPPGMQVKHLGSNSNLLHGFVHRFGMHMHAFCGMHVHRVFLKKSNQLKNNTQIVRGGSPRLRGNIGYCHLESWSLSRWVSSSIAREPVRHLAHAARRDAGNSCCCGRPSGSFAVCAMRSMGAGTCVYVRRRCSEQQVCSEHLWLSVESSLLTTHSDGSLPLMTLAVDGLPPSVWVLRSP